MAVPIRRVYNTCFTLKLFKSTLQCLSRYLESIALFGVNKYLIHHLLEDGYPCKKLYVLRTEIM